MNYVHMMCLFTNQHILYREVHDLIPGHGWEVKSVAKTDDNEHTQENDNNGDWVKDWVSRGSQDSINSKEADKNKVEKETPKVTNKKSTTSHTSSNASNSTKELTRPYELQRRVSSAARLSRLELRKQQSSVGSDSNRLFQAHEKGLTITPSGSSRRTLMRMGLPMERGLQRLHAPLDKPLNEQEDPNTMLLSSQTEANGNTTIEKTTFQKALAHMDERTIRKIEKEERKKQKEKLTLERSVTPHNGGGCISPFSMSILQHMFTSKQLSFKRSSSSYSRFDSFLNTPADTDIDESTVGLDGINGDAADDIFRPSARPSSTANRLKHLLVNAGFKSKMDDVVDNDHIVDAEDDDNAEILSTSTNSVAALLSGGPSFRNVDMFRESSADKKVEKKKPKSNDDTEEKPSSDDVPGTPTGVKKTHSDEEVEVSPAASDLGELPSQLPPLLAGRSRSGMSQSSLTQQRRGTAIGIMKTSSSSGGSPMRRGNKYERSVSWNHAVFEKEEEKLAMTRRDSAISLLSDGISVISFPNLKRAAPLRSESMSSVASLTLRPGRPVRSDSVASISSILSPFPSIGLGRPVLSSTGGTSFTGSLPSLSRARPVRSDSQVTMLTTDLDDDSLNSEDYVDVKPNQPNGAAWQSPLRPPRNPSSSGGTKDEQAVFIRQASTNNYEGEGMEVEESPVVESVDKARKYRSMLSGSSFKSSKSSSSSRPLLSLDDSFVIRNISISRHTLEILRSLSNEDLYSSHHLETINGTGSSSRRNEASSVARVGADQVNCDESWDLDSTSYAAANAWAVTEDPYVEGYNSLPFQILGTSANDTSCHPHVLSPPLMESLAGFMPETIAETNYFLKYSLVRDGAHLPSLLKTIRGTKHTLIAIETVEGEVFGSFTSSPWRKSWNYYGSGESFLWRMRRTRSEKDAQHSILDQAKLESELDVFYWSASNDMVQYCTHDMIALGGGTLNGDEGRDDQSDDQRNVSPPQSPGSIDKGGFGLCLESDLLYGTSSPCATFQSPPLSKSHADGSPFEILNIEVWTMSQMDSVEAAENLEMKSLFLESYTRE